MIIIILYSFLDNKPFLVRIGSLGIGENNIVIKLSDDSIVFLTIRDSVGAERFRSINKTYYRKTDCYIFIYDITKRNEFNAIKDYYIESIKEYRQNNVKVILVGNKTDLEDSREISYEEGANLAFLNNCLFIETSCLKNENIFETFEKIIGIYRISEKNNKKKNNEEKKNVSKKKKINNTCLLV